MLSKKMIFGLRTAEIYSDQTKMYSNESVNVLRDEKSSVTNLLKSGNLYAIQLLLVNNALTYEQFIDALKNYYIENSHSLVGEFTMDMIDLVDDYMDTQLVELFLKNMFVKKDGNPEIIDKAACYIRTLIDMGGTLPTDGKLIACLPDAIIEEYIDFETANTDVLISCMVSPHTNSSIKSKCNDLLQHWEEPVDKIFLSRTLLYHANKPADPEYFMKMMNYIHKQKDFEWIIFDTFKYITPTNITRYGGSLFPQGYVANKKISTILMMIGQSSFRRFTENMHAQTKKYNNINLLGYLTKMDVMNANKSQIYNVYIDLYNAVISNTVIVEEKYFKEHKARIYRFAKILLVALEQDDELQQFITSQ